MANEPTWLVVSTLAALGLAWATGCPSVPEKKGSPNAAMVPRLVGQVVGFLGNAGFPDVASLGGDQIGLGAVDEDAAVRAQQIADRVLMSTGYRASVGRSGDQRVLQVVRGPNVPPSIDRPMAQG